MLWLAGYASMWVYRHYISYYFTTDIKKTRVVNTYVTYLATMLRYDGFVLRRCLSGLAWLAHGLHVLVACLLSVLNVEFIHCCFVDDTIPTNLFRGEVSARKREFSIDLLLGISSPSLSVQCSSLVLPVYLLSGPSRDSSFKRIIIVLLVQVRLHCLWFSCKVFQLNPL